MKFSLSILSLLLLSNTISARKYTGSISGTTNPFIGRFSYPVDSSGGIVGSATISYTYANGATSSAGVYMYDDELWAQVYPSLTCGQAITKWTPDTSGFGLIPMPPNSASQQIAVTESLRPHMWYFTMAIAPDCSKNIELTSYTLELLQADGNQLGYDEIGMPAIFGVF